jgi:Zn-dependent protease with chaperone function
VKESDGHSTYNTQVDKVSDVSLPPCLFAEFSHWQHEQPIVTVIVVVVIVVIIVVVVVIIVAVFILVLFMLLYVEY